MTTNELAAVSLTAIAGYIVTAAITAGDAGAAGVMALCIMAGWIISSPARKLIK